MNEPAAPSDRTRVRRLPEKGRYDAETVRAILDAAFVCHVGFESDGQPWVIPTLYGRRGDELLIHGSRGSRMLRRLAGGGPVCVTVTLVDGLVVARSLFHSSMHYRSVVLLGTAREIAEPDAKLEALRAISEHFLPGRWDEARAPSEKELAATAVIGLPLAEASAKVSAGPPNDEPEDYALSIWAGVVPLRECALSARPDPRLSGGTPVPGSVLRFVERRSDRA